MARQGESFGDPRLVGGEIAPVPRTYRVFGAGALVPFWAALAITPASYAFACGSLSLAQSVAALAAGWTALALVGGVLARTPGRYGVGFVAQCRAAWGPRAAPWVMAMRWVVGVVWVAVWAHGSGVWVRRLGVSAASDGAPSWLREVLAMHLPGAGGVSLVAWGIAALLCAVLWPICRRGISRVGRFVIYGGAASAGFGAALVVFGGIVSKGFGDYIGRSPPWRLEPLVAASASVVVLGLPAVLTAGDWARFRIGAKQEGASPLASFTPIAALPAAVVLAFIGVAIASAARAVGGASYGHPIPDAAAMGGLPAGVGGVLLIVALWIGGAPLAGLYCTSLGLCGVAPRRIGYRRALWISVATMILAVPAVGYANARGIAPMALLAFVAPAVGVILVDELFVRRGRLLLEEAFLYSREYGPIGGVTVGAVLALLAGWACTPLVGELWWSALFADGAWPLAAHRDLAATGASLVVAGAIYLLLAPLERRLVGGIGGRVRGVVERTKDRLEERKPARFISGGKGPGREEHTNPYFEYRDDEPSTRADDDGD